MKIFYIYTALTTKGGADRVIINKANYLSEHGFEISIVTDSQNGRKYAFDVNNKVQLIDLCIDFGKEYQYKTILRGFIYLHLIRLYYKRLKRLLIKEKPDIVITTMGRELDFITSIHDGSIKIGEAHTTKRHLRNLYLLEQRGFPYNLIAKYWKNKMERNASMLNGLVVLTKEDQNSWKSITKTYVIPNFIPFVPLSYSKCTNKQAIIVGRYNDAKGYDYLIDAWKIVFQKHPDWIINIYGSGEYKKQVELLIIKNGLQQVIIMNEPTNNIIDKYLESSLCVLSSKYEGFSMALLEAMSCGLPCVSFDCPHGPRNIITDREDGLLVEYLNSRALADGICELIENEKLRKEMGNKARINIQRFSQDNIMHQWTDLFHNLKK